VKLCAWLDFFYAKALPEYVQAGIPLGEYIMVYFLSDRGIRQLTDNDDVAIKTHKKTEARLTGRVGINSKQPLHID